MKQHGFTLIELLICTAMVAILASAALPLSELTVKRQKEQQLQRALREMRDALDAHKQAAEDGRLERKPGDSGYPRRLEDLVQGVLDRRSAKNQRIYFLRRIPRDPFTENGKWGLRSYASQPDDPSEGDDVYDVYSLARGTGINGRPYREW